MKTVVLGAGVVGIATAYELAQDGHDVTVIDRREGPGLETSHANGGQLSWDHAAPLPAPGVVAKALKWLGRHDAPLLMHLRLDPALWSWTLRFLGSCGEAAFWRNAEHLLRLALYARERTHDILAREQIAFDHLQKGILEIIQDPREFNRELDDIGAWRELGGTRAALNRKQCIQAEPSLAHSSILIAGAIHTPLDESGDCYAFTCALAERCKALGVHFRWNTAVTGMDKEDWRITRVKTDNADGEGDETGDAFVLALGSYSPRAMKDLGLRLPIHPAKGYSVTVPVIDDKMAPTMSLTSSDHKLVFSRFGNRLRIAGMLELGAGYDTRLVEARARVALDNAHKLFPRAFAPEHATFWTGLRPLTPDSLPIIGRAKQSNLILNTGHGMLGWTLAAGTARIAADLAQGHTPAIDLKGLGWERFA